MEYDKTYIHKTRVTNGVHKKKRVIFNNLLSLDDNKIPVKQIHIHQFFDTLDDFQTIREIL